jgi:hypothetical protein
MNNGELLLVQKRILMQDLQSTCILFLSSLYFHYKQAENPNHSQKSYILIVKFITFRKNYTISKTSF